jgi:hypothetical protein
LRSIEKRVKMQSKYIKLLVLVGLALLVASCSVVGGPGASTSAGPTQNFSGDAGAAANYLPNLTGYTRHDVANIQDAITATGGGAALLSGNVAAAALITQLDRMIDCYRSRGAVAANVYTENNIAQVLEGQIPKVGALAVVNQNRVVNDFFSCALNQQSGDSLGAQSVEPCAGTGQFTANNETMLYLYAATDPQLCQLFQSAMPAS